MKRIIIPSRLRDSFASPGESEEWQTRLTSAVSASAQDSQSVARVLEQLALHCLQANLQSVMRWIMKHYRSVAMRDKPEVFCARAANLGRLEMLQLLISHYPTMPEEDLGPIFLEAWSGGQLHVLDWIYDTYETSGIMDDWDRAIRSSIQMGSMASLRWLLDHIRLVTQYRDELIAYAYEHLLSVPERFNQVRLLLHQMSMLTPDNVEDFVHPDIVRMIYRHRVHPDAWMPLLMSTLCHHSGYQLFVEVLDMGGFDEEEMCTMLITAAEYGLLPHVRYTLEHYSLQPDYQQMAQRLHEQAGLEINPDQHHCLMIWLLEHYPISLSAQQGRILCDSHYAPISLRDAYQVRSRDQELIMVHDNTDILLASMEPVPCQWEMYPVLAEDGESLIVYWDPEQRRAGGPDPPSHLIQMAHRVLQAQE